MRREVRTAARPALRIVPFQRKLSQSRRQHVNGSLIILSREFGTLCTTQGTCSTDVKKSSLGQRDTRQHLRVAAIGTGVRGTSTAVLEKKGPEANSGRLTRGDVAQMIEGLVDLVGIEPTTSSMPWSRKGRRRFVFKWLATGGLAGKRYIRRYFRPISGQKLATIKRAAWAGVHAFRTASNFTH
jgi:hypothetical protein